MSCGMRSILASLRWKRLTASSSHRAGHTLCPASRGDMVCRLGSTVGATGRCMMTPASWSVSVYTKRARQKSSGGCSSFPLPQCNPCKPTTHHAHVSRAEAWGSRDAASALPFQRNTSKINPSKVDTRCVIRSARAWATCPKKRVDTGRGHRYPTAHL